MPSCHQYHNALEKNTRHGRREKVVRLPTHLLLLPLAEEELKKQKPPKTVGDKNKAVLQAQ